MELTALVNRDIPAGTPSKSFTNQNAERSLKTRTVFSLLCTQNGKAATLSHATQRLVISGKGVETSPTNESRGTVCGGSNPSIARQIRERLFHQTERRTLLKNQKVHRPKLRKQPLKALAKKHGKASS